MTINIRNKFPGRNCLKLWWTFVDFNSLELEIKTGNTLTNTPLNYRHCSFLFFTTVCLLLSYFVYSSKKFIIYKTGTFTTHFQILAATNYRNKSIDCMFKEHISSAFFKIKLYSYNIKLCPSSFQSFLIVGNIVTQDIQLIFHLRLKEKQYSYNINT